MKKVAILIILVVFSQLVFASEVLLSYPQIQIIRDAGVVDLGLVGPGQTIKLGIQSGSNEFNPTNGKEYIWSQLQVSKQSLPSGWSGEDSLLFASDKIASVIVSKDAPDGAYVFELKATQESNQIAPLTFKAKVFVTKKVFDLVLLKDPVKIGVGEKAVYFFKLKNKSSASEAFKFMANGLPNGMSAVFTSPLVAPYSEQLIEYAVTPSEQGDYKFTLSATALSSEKLIEEQNFELFVGSNLFSDLKATTRGAMLFPSIEQAVYSLLGLFSLLF